MQLLNFEKIDKAVGNAYRSTLFVESLRKSMSATGEEYDIFLSHSFADRNAIRKLTYYLKDEYGLSVFVDWLAMPKLNRNMVDKNTATAIRDAIDRSHTLIYAYSLNSEKSHWMQWELGYADASLGKVAVMPLADSPKKTQAYTGQEYLGIYPYIAEGVSTRGIQTLWVNDLDNRKTNASFKHWKKHGTLIVRE
jgi:hypothetical protein